MLQPWNSDRWRIFSGPVSYLYNSTLNQVALNYLQRPALNRPYNSRVYPISGYGGQSTAAQIPAPGHRPYAGIVSWLSMYGPAPTIKNNPVAIPVGPNPLGILSGQSIG